MEHALRPRHPRSAKSQSKSVDEAQELLGHSSLSSTGICPHPGATVSPLKPYTAAVLIRLDLADGNPLTDDQIARGLVRQS